MRHGFCSSIGDSWKHTYAAMLIFSLPPLILVYVITRALVIFACDYVLLVYKDLFHKGLLVVSLMCNLNMGLNEFRLNCNSSSMLKKVL